MTICFTGYLEIYFRVFPAEKDAEINSA